MWAFYKSIQQGIDSVNLLKQKNEIHSKIAELQQAKLISVNLIDPKLYKTWMFELIFEKAE